MKENRLQAVLDRTAREYIWLPETEIAPTKASRAQVDRPLAVINGANTATPALWYTHVDHLNRPIMLTNASKAPVWTAIWQPWGAPHAITGTATLDTRFPGQWYQLEAGLHYNWHRHYDPSLGRYTQPDPLGFVDGPSVFGYARSRPQSFTDPNGQIVQALYLICVEGGCQAAVSALVAGAAILSSPAGQKIVKDTAKAISNTCEPPDDECKRLNEDVQSAKERVGSFSPAACKAGMSPLDLQIRKGVWLNLAISRARRDMKCWNGGDSGHQVAQANAWTHVGKCNQLLQ